jgi:acetyltransferase-like isoleucine patch superfamily enzyme
MSAWSSLWAVIGAARRGGANVPVCLARHAYYRLGGRWIVAHPNARIRGLGNIDVAGRLWVGTLFIGFLDNADHTYLHVRGRLKIRGNVNLGKGTRMDIGPGAVCELGSCYVSGLTRFIIMHGLRIGSGCAIAWDVEFLDEDFHTLEYPGRREVADPRIVIGDRVWIGSGAKILKGARIAAGSVVAANALVTGRFEEENVLIAGNPARVVRTGVSWGRLGSVTSPGAPPP